jgi:transmembrane sensor
MKQDEDDAAQKSARDAAIDWLMRINERPLSEKEAETFSAWLAAAPANRPAFEDISRMFGDLTTIRFDSAPARNNRLAWFGAAAVLMAASIAFFLFFDEALLFLRSDYHAGIGETKEVTLEDGSRIALAAESAIALRYGAHERGLTLLGGEAWFEVAPDPSRPFVVNAGGGTVTALGTAFDIALDGAAARVIVAQHKVLVASHGEKVVVEEGQASAFSRGAVTPPAPVDVARGVAWRRGKLIFDDRPLGEVVAVLQRYWRGRVFFADASLRSRRVSGVFSAGDPLLALEEIETALGVHGLGVSGYFIVLYD